MNLQTLPHWRQDALAVARAHPEEYVEIAQWLVIARQTSFRDEEPIAIVDLVVAIFAFESKNLCVLGVGHGGELILTHIFIKGSNPALSGRRNRILAAASAVGITPMSIR